MAKGFTFKQFHVNDHGCGMPVSTDGVLLGAWATLTPHAPILDIGCGSGILALMAAQRTAQASSPGHITAIDIDSGAVAAANLNFSASPWAARLQAVQADLADWTAQHTAGSFESIVCNPPYFNSGEQANCQARATARHTDSLPHATLLACLYTLLSDTGTASLILPQYEGEQLIAAAPAHHLVCTAVCEVQSTANKPVSRLLIALARDTAATASDTRTPLIIHESGGYSADFTALTRDFYLKM
ncbi:tRNA1(Val) (adenine(37)-N6)-methyltransferase [Photobacterium aphoticum]|uniref:tRNA1(Val) (adenine(37)-N6)-methyltransferase n=3 Tax=Photobacterium aphoticum TaxID=754436 RepID=A0A0J1GMW6_9GAMM|nr:methyltransferase [Photobacterium aphoticum]KLV00779.1 SAM-dependent methyltransferase [Photobacterium aphoticum]GHA51102.1 tRNA1(Val) (adenine(37)-N6)-methyltransferase [Photobacterium aphoticum]